MATQNVGYYDVKTGQWRAATPAEQQAALDARARQHRQARNQFIKGSVLGTAGVLAGGYGLASLGSASAPAWQGPLLANAGSSAAPATAATAALPSSVSGIGTTAGYGGLYSTPALGGAATTGGGAGVLSTVAPPAAKAAGFFSAGDLMRYGVPAAIGGVTSILGNRSANRNADLSLDEQRRQFDATQKFLADQQAQTHQDYLDWVAEQKRQFDMTEAEKLRQWEAMEPWREAGRGNLTRMNSLMDEPRQMPVEYKPTFQYRP